MKRTLSMITLAAFALMLLGSCAKINERLDSLEKKVDGIENEEIASIESQVESIESSISDLKSIRDKVQAMSDPATGLSKRIEDLKSFVSDVKKDYATKDWAKATFATMAEYEKTCDTVAKIALKVEGFDSSLKACTDSLKGWVNGKFGGYYDIATIDAKLAELQEQVDGVDSLSAELAKTREEIDTAKSAIRAEYRAAITSAIETSEGKLTQALRDSIDSVNATIGTLTGRVETLETKVEALKGRVDSLENMIQTVTIVPAYSDGSVEVKDDTLSIDLVVTPKDVVKTLDTADFTILLNKVLTKAVVLDTVPSDSIKVFTKDTLNGTVSIKAYIKETLAELEDNYSLTVAVNVKKDKSDFTTEFVPVTLPVSVSLDKHSIVVPSPESDADTILTATVKNSTKGFSWTSTEHCTSVDGTGNVTIKANVMGKDTIVVKTIEGNATDTCFVIVGAIPGEFTVNAQGRKVHFSQGNLYWDGSKFNFEANQYDAQTSWSISHVSHFFWSKSAEVAYAASFSESGTAATDVFFTNATTETAKSDFTVNGVIGKYRTLSKAEWQYLFNTSARMVNGKACYSDAVSGVTIGGSTYKGVFLYPDNYNGEIVSSSMTWNDINAAGIVFLPVAGYRNGNLVCDVGGGYYWSSTVYGKNYAYRVYFGDSVNLGQYDGRGTCGSSVRLITESN